MVLVLSISKLFINKNRESKSINFFFVTPFLSCDEHNNNLRAGILMEQSSHPEKIVERW